MDDLKLFDKMMQQLDSLVQTARIFGCNIGIQFGISKCAKLDMKRGEVLQNEWYNHYQKKRDISIWVCYNVILWKVKKWKIW